MSALFGLDWLERRPYRELHPRWLDAVVRYREWPEPEQYDQLAAQVPQAVDTRLPHFVRENREAVRRVGGYEQHVARLSAVPSRLGNWHDFFNMSVWAHFPKLRWALNSLHVDPEIGVKDPRNGRAPAQNLAATFDEAGMLVLSTSASILEELRGLRFRSAFWERRDELNATTRFWIVGHGMLESLIEPRPGLSVRSLQLHVSALPALIEDDQQRFELDAALAVQVRAWRTSRAILDPLPVLAIPGYSANDFREFYEDRRNVRFDPVSRRPAALLAAHASQPISDRRGLDGLLEGGIDGEQTK